MGNFGFATQLILADARLEAFREVYIHFGLQIEN
jgi:hypothetical protein